MSIECIRTIPILHIFRVEKAKEFYIGWPGFKIDWKHQFEQNTPKYRQVSRGHLVLHLSEHHGDACPPISRLGRNAGLGEFHREIVGKNYKYNRPGPEHTPWQAKCGEAIDPFGSRIRFNEHAAK